MSSRAVIRMTIEDADHISDEERAEIIASYPAHEREARVKGIPALGSGRVFPIAESEITVEPSPELRAYLKANARWIIGIDFGWDHPTAAVCMAHDTDNDTLYVTNAYRRREATPLVHSAPIKAWGDWIPVAWPHDGEAKGRDGGEPMAAQYRAHGLNMLQEKASHEEGGNGVEAGIAAMLELMETDRLKVFANLEDWFQEFRLYHRKDGVIVKERDDLMDGTRYAFMMRRHAGVKPKPRTARKKRSVWAA